MSKAVPEKQTVRVDFSKVSEVIDLGLRRVSAFLKLGIHGNEDVQTVSFDIAAGTTYRFWPDEIPKEARRAVAIEFNSWLLGSCLKELDLFYGLFLDEVWKVIQMLDLHGKSVSTQFEFDKKLESNSNVARKQKFISEKLGTADHFEQLNSLSLARNCLAHNAGIVRSGRDCNNDNRDMLILKWRAMDVYAERAGNQVLVQEMPFDVESMPGEGPAQLFISYSNKSTIFPANSRLEFKEREIAELCMFYKIISDEVISGCVANFRDRGIPTAVVGAPPADANRKKNI